MRFYSICKMYAGLTLTIHTFIMC